LDSDEPVIAVIDLRVLADTLRHNGYVVIPKERVRCYTMSSTISRMMLELHKSELGIRAHISRNMGEALTRDLLAGEAAVWSEREVMDAVLMTAEVQVILPKPKET
jgi:hypothetical protein